MSITTYAELQTFIQAAVDRTDSSLPVTAADLITLVESRLNRILPLRVLWTDGTLTGTVGSRAIALPAGFIEPVALFLTTFGVQQKLMPFVAGTIELLGAIAGTPTGWCINGTNINLDLLCDRAHTFSFRYRTKLAIATDLTNWLLTNHPDIYVFASLVELWTFLQKPDNAAAMHQRLDLAIAELAERESRSISVAPLRTDVMGPMPFNINTG